MLNLDISPTPASTVAQNTAALPRYNTDVSMDLPADAAPMGVLANGDIYFKSYEMLTPNDISMLKEATGQSFDSTNIAAEQATNTFQNNGLAAAIGFDRANSVLGLNGLSGNITATYLQTIKNTISDPNGDGTYEGFQISQSDLNAAFSAVTDQGNSTVSLSA